MVLNLVVKKKMKRITTVYLEEELINLARMENLNVSEFINTVLQEYLSVNSTEDIDKEIEEHGKMIHVLEEKRKRLIEQGATETKLQGMASEVEAELRKNYIVRRQQIGDNPDLDLDWLNSPKNLQRCKIMGKEPIIMVKELRYWYKNNGGKS